MVRTTIKYAAILTGLYLVTYRATEAGSLVTNGANGIATIEKTLQGRG